MKTYLTIGLLTFCLALFGQEKDIKKTKEKKEKEVSIIDTLQTEPNWEKPLNFFAAAGAAYRFGDQYNVTISPVDYTVQFEQVYPVITRFSLGLVWNPFPDKRNESVAKYLEGKKAGLAFDAARRHLAVALIVNVFQLGYSSNDFSTNSPIDVGFGIGYRKDNFLILGTLDFTPVRTPRSYFVDSYKGQNKQLILADSSEPVRTISTDDNSLFIDKIYPSIGIKIAYTFAKKEEKN
ncbi:hypothetical protein [Mariniflexile sp. AS56]|uniref:hypothetical protein n=1 Tax=Mariniflexile sp. AS56 TaxID=3063957 RepID=UPI00398B5BFA